MNPEEILTPEQKENLKTWAEQRDSILSEISILKTESESLKKANKELTDSNTDVETRMVEIRGRIEELKVKKNDLALIIPVEIARLQSEKTALESEVSSLLKIVELLTSQKTSLEADVSFALSTFNTVKNETLLLEKVVEKVTSVSHDNTSKIDSLVEELGRSIGQIIKVNKKNVDETNMVIDKLPRIIMELQKRGLIKNKI